MHYCEQQYYEADTGFMCWLTKRACNKQNCILKKKLIKDFSRKVVKNLKFKAGE